MPTFKNYPNLKWTASVEVQVYYGADELQTTPHLPGFCLSQIQCGDNNLSLIGSNDTTILVTGPQEGLDMVLSKLKECEGLSWTEIKNIG